MIAASRHRFSSARCATVVVAVSAALATAGCKSGNPWAAKPSWWTFGGTDAAKLADTPPSAADVAKPSTVSQPYPTTTTPEGYVLEKSQGAGASQVAATATTAPAAPPAVVTYGSQPVAAATGSPPREATQPQQAQPSGLASIAPQVGPYGGPPAAPAVPEQSLPGGAASFTATPSSQPVAEQPVMSPVIGGPSNRVADARSGDSWPQPTASPAAAGGDRYGASTGSRFTSASLSQAAASEPAVPPPATLDAAPIAPPTTSPAMPPAAWPPAAPPVPTRRTDPGYRPGGTSSYRPARSLLAGSDPAAASDSRVAPVSFESPVGQ